MKEQKQAEPKRYTPDAGLGLTAAQAAERAAQGLTNEDGSAASKSAGRIIFENVCTLFNLVIALLALALILVGSYKNLLFAGVMLCNLVIGTVQELRAKRVIDRLSILSAARVRVIRDGERTETPVGGVVLDDVLELTRGSQVPADCVLLTGGCDVNESLLTGEPDAIHKQPGDRLLSGSFLVNGSCRARADRVGAATYVSGISNEARKPKRVISEITRSLRRLIRVISIIIFPLGALLFWNQYSAAGSLRDAVVSSSAALIGMIPSGLVLLTSVVLTMSAVRLSRRRVLVQELYCIESLARVDVLCLDKTGTITEGAMELRRVAPLDGVSEESLARALAAFCAVAEDETATFRAIEARYSGGSAPEPDRRVPFSSEQKWSGVGWDGHGSLLLGAPEFLLPGGMGGALEASVRSMAGEGRVLLFAAGGGLMGRALPQSVRPLGLLLVQDKIRADAPDTLRFFTEQGVALKVISGDNPVTVSAIARRVGLPDAGRYVDASALSPEELERAMEEYAVFGRVSPHQKRAMVRALQKRGHTVAMTGDGVNDVLALKQADCSVAMASGSEAARNVSHLVLLDSDFAAMPDVVYEGRRSINNLQRSASLFLVKTIFSIGLALLFLFLTRTYPFQPVQLTLISTFMIGIPSVVLALEPNKNRVRRGFLRNVVGQALPGALTIVSNVAAAALLAPRFGFSEGEVSTLCVLLTAFTGLLLLFRLCDPFTPLRRALFCTVCAGLCGAVLLLSPFFSLSPMRPALFFAAACSFAGCAALFHLLRRLVRRRDERHPA